MKFLTLIILSFFILPPAHAQGFEEEIIPEGPRGRISTEQGEEIALRRVSGELVGTDIEQEDGRYFYEYSILTADGSVFEVEVNAQTGEVFEIEVERLSADPVLPVNILSPEALEAIAVSEVDRRQRSTFKIRVLNSALVVFNRKLAYRVEVKQSLDRFAVIVDARDGEVLRVEKID